MYRGDASPRAYPHNKNLTNGAGVFASTIGKFKSPMQKKPFK